MEPALGAECETWFHVTEDDPRQYTFCYFTLKFSRRKWLWLVGEEHLALTYDLADGLLAAAEEFKGGTPVARIARQLRYTEGELEKIPYTHQGHVLHLREKPGLANAGIAFAGEFTIGTVNDDYDDDEDSGWEADDRRSKRFPLATVWSDMRTKRREYYENACTRTSYADLLSDLHYCITLIRVVLCPLARSINYCDSKERNIYDVLRLSVDNHLSCGHFLNRAYDEFITNHF